MLNDLEALAAEIANLSKACAEMEGKRGVRTAVYAAWAVG